ncbi:hypothetical protein WJX84_004102 [Apatococcus fuscideae]|uniref:Uncharacterized protein n=1 Tax=Apatococcus fuscideae TaxID=2026836 RepID=A0AAW1TDQ1_9CHLO
MDWGMCTIRLPDKETCPFDAGAGTDPSAYPSFAGVLPSDLSAGRIEAWIVLQKRGSLVPSEGGSNG